MSSASAMTNHASQLPGQDLTRLRMALGRLGRVLRQQSDDALPYALVSLIMTIARLEPTTASELAESEKVTPPSVSRSLQRLEELGFITRTRDEHDGRVIHIGLSAGGRRERETLLKSRDAWLSERLSRLDSTELDSLMTALPALEKLCEPGLPRSRPVVWCNSGPVS